MLSAAEWLMLGLFAAASVLHGISGMGFPMITTASLLMWYSLPEIIVFTLVPTFSLNVYSLSHGSRIGLILKRYTPLAIASCIGSMIGAKYLLQVPTFYLEILLGSVILLFVVQSLWMAKSELQLPNTWVLQIIFGLSAGIVGGATNAMAPLLMMFLLSSSKSHKDIAQAANLCFLVSKLAQIAVLYPRFLALPMSTWMGIGIVTVLSLVGLRIGIYWRQFLSWRLFKNIILIILSLLAMKSFYQAASSLLH